MKKIIACLLTILMLFPSINIPVSARESEYGVTNVEPISAEDTSKYKDGNSMTEKEFSQTSFTQDITTLDSISTNVTGLYRSQLTGKALEVYYALDGADLCAEYPGATVTVTAPKATYEEVEEEYMAVIFTAMFAYYRDHLDSMMWATNEVTFYASASSGSSSVVETLQFPCIFTVSDYYTSAIGSKLTSTINSVVSNCSATTTYDKLKYYHDWLVNNNEYDTATSEIDEDDGSQAWYYAHSPVGCLINGKGVCESYAKAFKVFCLKEDLPCVEVTSATHAWDYVKIGQNKWYMIDCTWDDPNDIYGETLGVCNYDFFLVSNNPAIDAHHTEDDCLIYPTTESSDYTHVTECTTHTWDSGYVVDPTCTDTGYTLYTCTVCGETKIDDVTDKTSHTYDSEDVIAKTCTTSGLKKYYCTICGYSYYKEVSAGHTLVYEIVPATCNSYKHTISTCTVCGYSFTTLTSDRTLLDHTWNEGKIIMTPTCCTTGMIRYTCTVCKKTKEESLDIDSTNHSGGTEVKNYKAATTTEEGYTGDTYCSGCGELLEEGTVIAKVDCTHNYKASYVAATCTSQGYTEYTCTECGNSYKTNYTSLKDHSYDSGVVTVAATCSSTGLKTYTCTVCGAVKTEEISKDTSNHSGILTATVTSPTCTAQGYTTYTCSDCNGSYKSNYTSALGHTWNSGVITAPATCKSTGVKTYTCSVCGATKTESIAKSTTHSYVPGSIKKASTSNKKGYYYPTCSVCGKKSSIKYTYYAKTLTISPTSYVYSGSANTPKVTVKDYKGNTISSDYYTVTYSSNKSVGTAKVTVKMNTLYSGTLTKTFKISPVGTELVSLTAASKAFTATWNAQKTQTTGYQICYSTSSKFKSPKYITVSGNSKTSYTKKSLSKKKKYYVRIRTYKTVGKTKYYSSWSSAMNVTTK